MKAHKNWGIAALVFMLITGFSILCKPIRKSHAVWGCISLLCLMGAIASGNSLMKPKKKSEDAEVLKETEAKK